MTKFITFEGGEGAGKSTQIRLLADYLRQRGEDVVLTREPGGTNAAEKIREILLGDSKSFLPKTEVLLNFAARLEHVESLVKPALASGKTVLCDRFFDSTYIYQAVAQDAGREFVDLVRAATLGDFAPNKTILLDIDPQISVQRAKARGSVNFFEGLGLDFHQKVRAGFLNLAKNNPRFIVLDASCGIDDLHLRIVEKLCAAQ